MHAVAAKIGDRDFKAIMQFVLISLVILPVLPNTYFGPYQVLNPQHLWLMVVLIVGISLGAYILYKFFGEKVGTLAGGILGGLISSTATTVSYARRSRQAEGSLPLAAVVISVASCIVFLRVLILINITAPQFLRVAGPPLGIMLGTSGLLAAGLWWASRREQTPMLPQDNPSELRAALLFGILYGAILIGSAAAKDYFGSQGLYAVSIVSGLTDMDAITLSLTQLVNSGSLPVQTAWRMILAASMSNLIFKAMLIAILGGGRLFQRTAWLLLAVFATGVVLLLAWKD